MRHALELLVPSLLVLATGCTNTFLELHPRESALGEGLTGAYYPQITTCDPGDVYPAGCDQQIVNISSVKSRGAIEVSTGDDGGFLATGMAVGEGDIEVAASGYEERATIEVAPVVYSMISWWGQRTEPAPFGDVAPDRVSPVFVGSEIELFQRHYRVLREEVAVSSVADFNEVVLHGRSKFEIVPGTAQVALVEMDAVQRPYSPFPRIALAAGTVPGTATVTTHEGGELAVTVVDTSAIVSLYDYYLTTGDDYDQYSDLLDRFVLAPVDAMGRGIKGCPAQGPTVTDTAGILTVRPIPTNENCVFELALAPGKTWQDTTIVAVWNQAELRVPVHPW